MVETYVCQCSNDRPHRGRLKSSDQNLLAANSRRPNGGLLASAIGVLAPLQGLALAEYPLVTLTGYLATISNDALSADE